jgi:pyruvate formate lyase activating enzyme
MTESAWIHSVDTFSALDGPGIRTVFYFQGCPLRCIYCHNPDTWPLRPPSASRHTVEALMRILRRNRPYYGTSGGVTCSGGEPLLQAAFIAQLFRQCRQENLSTALDSAFSLPGSALEPLLPYTDLALAGIKHLDAQKHLEITGAGGSSWRENLRRLADSHIPIWLRYVVVPGWTDQPEAIDRLGELAAELPHVVRIDLLPYHNLGEHKWALLGLPYTLSGLQLPTAERLQQIKSRLRAQVSPAVAVP